MPDPTPAPNSSANSDTPPVADGAQTLDTASNQLFGIKPDQSQTTPTPQSSDGQAKVAPVKVEGDGTGKPAAATGTPPAGQGEPEVKDEDVLAAMAPTETPEATLARTKREAGASRAEALRLKKVDEGTRTALKSQGLDLVLNENGEVVGFAPNAKYNGGKAENLSVKFTDLTEAQQTLFESDPQALIDHVLSQAKSALARVAPTIEKPFQSLSPEVEQATIDHVAGLVLEDGETKKHPNIVKNLTIIRQNINAPSNAALKEFYHRQPDLALTLLDSFVDKTRMLLAKKAQLIAETANKKKQVADSTLSPAPAGGGEAVIMFGNASPEELAKAWGKEIGQAE